MCGCRGPHYDLDNTNCPTSIMLMAGFGSRSATASPLLSELCMVVLFAGSPFYGYPHKAPMHVNFDTAVISSRPPVPVPLSDV